MTPEEYWAYKAFTRDDADKASLRNSEVFQSYAAAESEREQKLAAINERVKKAEEDKAFEAFEQFEQKVKSSPELLQKFREVRAALNANPELIDQVDPSFVAGIDMLDLE